VDLYEVSYGRTNVWYYDTKYPEKKLETIDKVTLKLTDVKGFWHNVIEIFEKIFDHVKK
jgi:hypothetical protein